MVYLVSSFSALVFVALFLKSGLITVALQSISIAKGAYETMRDADLDDEAREHAIQSSGITLLKMAVSLFFRFVFVLGGAMVPILIADQSNFVSQQTVFEFMSNWEFLLGSTVIVTIGYALLSR
jgi:hypothetical protein